MTIADKLAALAAGAEPPPLDGREADRLVERAIAMAAIRPARPKRWVVAMAVASAAAAGIAIALLAGRTSPAADAPLHVTLPTGDQLTGTAGVQFEVVRLAADDRALRLHHGEMLFDVAHVVPRQRFQVATPHLAVTAKGTVFSVETDAASSRVAVYEGAVEVEQDGRVVSLGAGASWDSRTRRETRTASRSPALAPSIEVALRDRDQAARAVTDDDPSVAMSTGSNAAAGAPSIAPMTGSNAAAVAPADRLRAATDSLRVAADSLRAAADTLRAAADSSHATASTAGDSSAGGTRGAITDSSAAGTRAAIDSPAGGSSRAPDPRSLDDLFATARAELAAGKLTDVLELVGRARARAPLSGAWWLMSADALRGLGRFADAANHYDAAAEHLHGTDHIEAGYSAAYVRFHDLHDGATALASLDLAGADAAGSPLEERALGLRAQILVALGRFDAARGVATRYLARFPRSDLQAYMAALARPKR